MPRRCEQLIDGRMLRDPARVHHEHVVAELGDDAQVVRDEQHRHAVLVLQPAQELEDLRLHGDVERRRRLVGDQELRAARDRHRDHDALPHAARELVRILVEPLRRRGNADLLEQLDGALAQHARLGARLVEPQRLEHLAAHGVHGVQRGHRFLEDHRDAAAAHVAHLRPA